MPLKRLKNTTMSKLIIFGDENSINLHQQVGMNSRRDSFTTVVNKSQYGVSLKFCIQTLMSYRLSAEYSTNDVILFLIPKNTKSPIINADVMNPSFAALYYPELVLRDITNNNKITQESINEIKSVGGLLAVEHYKQFYDFYKMYYTAYSVKQIVAERFMLLNILKQLPNKVFLLQDSENLVYDWTHRQLSENDHFVISRSIELLSSTDTFINTGIIASFTDVNSLGKILYDKISANLSS